MSFLRTLIMSSLCWLLILSASAQDPCGFDYIFQKQLENPDFRAAMERQEARIQAEIRRMESEPQARNSNIINIPIVVHIIHLGEPVGTGTNISDAQVISAIDRLNDIYSNDIGTSVDSDIEFCLAQRLPNCGGNPTTAINRVDGRVVPNYETHGIELLDNTAADELAVKSLSVWDPFHYLNVWVVSEIDNEGPNGVSVGYAKIPDISGSSSTFSQTDGIVLTYNTMGYDPDGSAGYTLRIDQNKGFVLPHEMGHMFNLFHTFQGDENGNCPNPIPTACWQQGGDCVTDTPPHLREPGFCPNSINSCDPNGPSLQDVAENIMNYSDQDCFKKFSPNQVVRMRASFVSTVRVWMRYHDNCSPMPTNNPVIASCTNSTTNVPGANQDQGIIGVLIGSGFGNYDFQYFSGDTQSDGGSMDFTCNQAVVDIGSTNYLEVRTGPQVNENVKAYIDFNDDGMFQGSELVMNSMNNSFHQANFQVPANAVADKALRLRVISDIASRNISNACFNPRFGQAEDYTIFIGQIPLPVSWLSFEGQKTAAGIQLDWSTASEQNSDYFQVERSADGQKWTSLGTRSAAGFSQVSSRYQFLDTAPIDGINYYRLKQVDLDGQSDLSTTVSVRWSNFKAYRLLPNPTDGDLLRVQYESDQDQAIEIHCFDTHGRMLRSWQFESQRGENNHNLQMVDIPAGVYLLQIQRNGQWESQRFVKN